MIIKTIPGIYKTNIINNKIYIGSSCDIRHRWYTHVHTKERSKHRRKEYMFIDPQGNIHNIVGLNAFCKKYNLHTSNMCQVAKGKLNSYKGWTITEEY